MPGLCREQGTALWSEFSPSIDGFQEPNSGPQAAWQVHTHQAILLSSWLIFLKLGCIFSCCWISEFLYSWVHNVYQSQTMIRSPC